MQGEQELSEIRLQLLHFIKSTALKTPATKTTLLPLDLQIISLISEVAIKASVREVVEGLKNGIEYLTAIAEGEEISLPVKAHIKGVLERLNVVWCDHYTRHTNGVIGPDAVYKD